MNHSKTAVFLHFENFHKKKMTAIKKIHQLS